MTASPTGRMMEATSKQLRTPHYAPSSGAQRVVDAYQQVYQRSPPVDADLSQLECRIHGIDFSTERVLAMPRALGAPFGAAAQRQWAKKYRFYDRLRIARKRKK